MSYGRPSAIIHLPPRPSSLRLGTCFSMVNLARHLKVEPEFALRHTNAKFRRRFAAMEAASPRPLETLSPDQLELLWSQAKLAESPSPSPLPSIMPAR